MNKEDYNKFYIQGSDHYLIPKDVFKELFNEMINWKEENKQLKEQLLVAQTNEETFRLEMEDITQTLGLAEDTLFDDVKVYARSLKDNWNKIEQIIENERMSHWAPSPLFLTELLSKMQELEQGSDK